LPSTVIIHVFVGHLGDSFLLFDLPPPIDHSCTTDYLAQPQKKCCHAKNAAIGTSKGQHARYSGIYHALEPVRQGHHMFLLRQYDAPIRQVNETAVQRMVASANDKIESRMAMPKYPLPGP